MIGEMISKKHDRFGWDRMDAAIRTLIRQDFMDALQDYPIDEIRAATRQCEAENPDRMPNEQHIKAKIIENRERKRPRIELPKFRPEPIGYRGVPDAETARDILAAAGFTPKRFAAVKAKPMATSRAELESVTERTMAREEYMTPDEIAREDRQ